MNRKTMLTIASIFLLQVVVTVVIWQFGDSELVIFDNPGPVDELASLGQVQGGCIDVWTTEICTYAGIERSELLYCACLDGAVDCSCEYILDDGCVQLGPTDALPGFEMCARDFARTSNSFDVTTSALVCERFLIWDLCLTIWRQQLTFSR
jgi:hypothetical protein